MAEPEEAPVDGIRPRRQYALRTFTFYPEYAKELLRRSNTRNRPISSVRLRVYAKKMRQGEWAMNGETISFDWDGNILNGHHRLEACVQAGVPFTTAIAEGIDPKNFTTYDLHKGRTPADTGVISGLVPAAYRGTCAAVGRIVYAWEAGIMEHFAQIGVKDGWSNGEFIDILTRHEHLCQLVISGMKMAKPFPQLKPSYAGFMRYATSLVDNATSVRFMEAVCTGNNLGEKDPCLLLRRRLLTNSNSKSVRMLPTHELAICVKAWRAFCLGQTPDLFKYTPAMRTKSGELIGREPFPEINPTGDDAELLEPFLSK